MAAPSDVSANSHSQDGIKPSNTDVTPLDSNPIETVQNPIETVESLQSHLATLEDGLAMGDSTHSHRPRGRWQRQARLSVLMPVFNERWTISEVIQRVLNAPVDTDIEIVAVDDCSTDGSGTYLEELAVKEPRLNVIRHDRNQGKGAAIRTAISHMSGDIALIQDADLEYDPRDYPKLLDPILTGEADAVFGSRYASDTRRVQSFWHRQVNRVLTTASNMLTDLNLTDMETCYKAFKADVLRQLRLESNTFTIEPELTCRLSQWGARVHEVPIDYRGRSFQEGKKIRPFDGVKAFARMVKTRFIDPKFTDHTGLYVLKAMERAQRYNKWVLNRCQQFLGNRLLEAGAGIGNLSTQLLNRERLLLVDYDELYVERLRARFGHRSSVRVLQSDLTDPACIEAWQEERLDTIVCSNVLEHLEPDQQVLQSFSESLVTGGHCLIVVPSIPKLHNGLDEDLGHFRRYTADELKGKMDAAGFDIAYTHQFCKVGAVGWWFNGSLLGRRHLSPFQMRMFDRLWPVLQHADKVLPWSGMSLAMIGKKR